MKFLEIVRNLQKENSGSIVLVRCGAFFVSVGKDAVILSEKLNLKVTCITRRTCKIGIPITSIYEYIKKLENIGFSFVIYNYSKDEMLDNGKKYAEAYRFEGESIEKEECCLYCEKCTSYKDNRHFDNITLFEDLKKLQKAKGNNTNEQK